MMSRLMHEEVLRDAIADTPDPPPKPRRMLHKHNAEPMRTRMSVWKQGKGRTLEFEDGISEIDEEIERIVNEKFQKRREETALQERMIHNQKMFNHLKKRAVRKKKPTAASQNVSPRSLQSEQSEEVIRPPLTVTETTGRWLPRLPKSLTPRATIAENLSIMRTLNSGFLRNVKSHRDDSSHHGRASDNSVFLTDRLCSY